jgi:uncharacterized membrane-anchored protein YjiN (DUF445 family)
MTKETELKNAKRLALSLLAAATAVFLVTSLLPKGFWVNGVKAVSEAAMVGALADWFAVVALFKKVPIPFISAHTNIIPNNKNKIADNLAIFVEEKFLHPAALSELILKNDPATNVAEWLAQPANRRILSAALLKLIPEMLNVADDARIQALVRDALHAAIAKLDLSQSFGGLLEGLTKDGRHQELLDDSIDTLIGVINRDSSREMIAGLIADWLRREHAAMQLVLPTGWLSEHGAAMIANTLKNIMENVAADKEHKLRRKFDETMQKFVVRLKSDPAFIAKGEELKAYLRDGDAFNTYIKELWGGVRAWLQNEINAAGSKVNDGILNMSGWLSEELLGHPEMRKSLNEHLAGIAMTVTPAFSRFLTTHISDTVKSWDEKDMSRQIELNIGKDLQYIRVNGTLVGGLIGLLLYASSYAIELLRAT